MKPIVSFDDPVERIDALLAEGKHRAAWAEMIHLVEREPTGAVFQAVADAATKLSPKDADLVPVRVGLLANFTIDLVAPLLLAQGLPSRLLVDPYVAGFDTWIQEILDPSSSLREAAPDVVVLALQLEALSPALAFRFLELTPEQVNAEVESALARIEEAVVGLRAWSRAKVLIHAFPTPITPALGILDARLSTGQTATVRRLNEQLASLAERIGDVFLVDLSRLVASIGAVRWQDARLWGMAKIPFSQAAARALAAEYVRYLRAFKGLSRKVLVLDLDDTLWGGILGEDGIEGIRLGDEYPGRAFVELQQAILGLHRRGVVLAINSKNNEEDVLEVLMKHPSMVLRPEHFAATRINWQDKSANMSELADELGLSLDSFVFIDDSEVECERMRQSFPEVMTVRLEAEPAARAGAVLALGVFDTLSYSDEDRKRGALYKQEAPRTKLRAGAQSLDDFYRSLDMVLDVYAVGRAQVQRAADLTQRTNQFNLTTRRYTVDELTAALRASGCEAYAFRLTDRFGDNGIIGVGMIEVDGSRGAISNLLMSCRVLRRTVEDAVLAFLMTRARELGACEIEGRFRPTRKNGQTKDFYRDRGFSPIAPDGDTERFVRSLAEPIESPKWIVVRRHEAADAV